MGNVSFVNATSTHFSSIFISCVVLRFQKQLRVLNDLMFYYFMFKWKDKLT